MKNRQMVLMCRGLPGSGKSTFAKELIDESQGRYKRVSKDDLRAMIDNSHYSKVSEKMIQQIQDELILKYLANGYSVIIDNTNFGWEEHFEKLVEDEATFDIQDFTHIPIEECIANDLKRSNSVGSKVILDMASKYIHNTYIPPKFIEGLPYAWIVDIDGSIAKTNGRGPYDFDKVDTDIVHDHIARLVLDSQKHKKIIWLSGRDNVYRDKTHLWLNKNGFAVDRLLMRKNGDKRNDSIIKEEIYREEIEGKYNICLVIDDRGRVLRCWQKLGLPVISCGPEFEF